jgi:hypothetical protein
MLCNIIAFLLHNKSSFQIRPLLLVVDFLNLVVINNIIFLKSNATTIAHRHRFSFGSSQLIVIITLSFEKTASLVKITPQKNHKSKVINNSSLSVQ